MPPFLNVMNLKLFTAFSGYDSQALAMRELAAAYGFDFDLVGWSEIEPHAIIAHDALFPQFAGRNYGDICKIDWGQVPDFDLFTYSSPCQDFSTAGFGRGGEEGSQTRSSLLWECWRAIEAKRPKFCVLENVANLVSSRHRKVFHAWQAKLETLGYKNYPVLLNSQNFGVPQSRERVFLISMLDGVFFPPKKKLTKTEFLEIYDNSAPHRMWMKPQIFSDVFNCGRSNVFPLPGYNNGTKKFYVNNLDGETMIVNCTEGGNVRTLTKSYSKTGHANIVRCTGYGFSGVAVKEKGLRRLTTRECFRLMGMQNSDIEKIESTSLPHTAKYNLAGNSIVVPVLVEIFRKILIDRSQEQQQLSLPF